MLKSLHIANLILVENTVISFEKGFNVLTGETGSGKTAVLTALNLIAGERAILSQIRKGAPSACVIAAFDIEKNLVVQNLLQELGIEHAEEEYLLIRREIHLSGKGRIFINHQPAQLALLKQLGELLILLTGQHASIRLQAVENHRKILDTFGGLSEEVADFAASYQREMALLKEIEEFREKGAARVREEENCRRELEELAEVNVKDGEVEELFSEYNLLSHAEELKGDLEKVSHGLSKALTSLNQQKPNLEAIVKIDPSLQPSLASWDSSYLELQEVAFTLSRTQNRVEINPDRLNEVSTRLTLLEKLKKKYGPDLEKYKNELKIRLAAFEVAEEQMEVLQKNLKELAESNQEKAILITQKRKKIATQLQKRLRENLRELNMPHAEFEVEISPQNRNASGDDRVEFFLHPNVGEPRIAIRTGASGGELSRVLLALQALLVQGENIPTVVFDEIDANIGGSTAHVVGLKLKELGNTTQVLSVTHFPQVARHADHHLQIEKKEVGGRTLTFIHVLNDSMKAKELFRMQGVDSN